MRTSVVRPPKISVYPADAAPDAVINAYVFELKEQIRRTPAYLNNISKSMLTAPGNSLVVVHENDKVLGGLYTKTETWEGLRVRKLNGLFSKLKGHGFARHIISCAMSHSWDTDRLAAVVRVMPSGEVNAAAARAFALNGFFPTGIKRYSISDNTLDSHLYATAEPDGKTYRAVVLISRSKDQRTS